MINKVNLLRQYSEAGEPVPDPMPITPFVEGQYIVFQNAIHLLPAKERSGTCTETDQEVLYFISGNGSLKSGTEEEIIESGDRVILSKDQSYTIINTSTSPLNFLSIGIRFKQ